MFSNLRINPYFVKGLHVWGVFLGLYGVKELFISRKSQILVLTLIVITSLITRFYIFNVLINPDLHNPFFFLKEEEGRALKFIEKLPADSGVLSLYRIGNYIPANSNLRVYFGHYFQTPQSSKTLKNSQKFYVSMSEGEQREFVKRNNIQYVYYGLEETGLRKKRDLSTDNPFSHFTIVYQNNLVTIYSTRLEKSDYPTGGERFFASRINPPFPGFDTPSGSTELAVEVLRAGGVKNDILLPGLSAGGIKPLIQLSYKILI